jgi:hypothetical protein
MDESFERNQMVNASKTRRLKREIVGWKPVRPTASTGFMERAMGIEPVANSLSPVESVGLTLREDLIWA